MDVPLSREARPAGQGRVSGKVRASWRDWHLRPHALLFCLLLLTFSYTPPRWQDWNQNSRFDLTRAIVERGTVRIDDYAGNTGDYATIDGHRYSDKAPGLSLAAVPIYALTRAAQPLGLGQATRRVGQSEAFAPTLNPRGAGVSGTRIDLALALFLATLLTVGLSAAFLGVLVALVVERLWGCRTAGLLTALIFGLATPLFPYAQAFYGHLPAAACIFAALAVLVLRPGPAVGDRRLIALGALLALAVVIEYPAAVTALPLAVWALALARLRAVLFATLGAIGPLATLVAYDLVAFKTPWPVGYAHSTLWQAQHQQGFLSVTYPKWEAVWGLTLSPFRGLFFFAPVLLLTLAGCWFALRSREGRAATIVALAGFGATFLFVASSAMWWGGFAVGPRYLLPGLPLLAVPFGALVAWCNGRPLRTRLAGLGTIAALAGLSMALVWATTFARQNYPPDTLRHPLRDYVLPALREGDIARNLGMALHLPGAASLLPLVALLLIGTAVIAFTLRPAAAGRVRA